MSWYNRRPKAKEPIKPVPHHTSPMTEKHLEESKKAVRKAKNKSQSK